MPSLTTHTEIEIEAMLCVWEHLLENPEHYADFFENYGSSAMRHVAMEAGLIVERLYSFMEEQGYEFHASYDWDFVPEACGLLDWAKLAEHNQYNGPDYDPDLAQLSAQMLLKCPNDFKYRSPENRWKETARAESIWLWGVDIIEEVRLDEDPREYARRLGEKLELTPRR